MAQVTVDAFPIPRGGGARAHLDYLKQLLAQKWSVIIFPEGRLTVTGAIGAFRKGAAILAIDTGVPIVPAYVDGMFDVLPRFRRVPRPGHVTVRFGAQVHPEPSENYDGFIGRVERIVRNLAGPKGIAVEPPGASRSEGPYYWYGGFDRGRVEAEHVFARPSPSGHRRRPGRGHAPVRRRL